MFPLVEFQCMDYILIFNFPFSFSYASVCAISMVFFFLDNIHVLFFQPAAHLT
jgi:hypothetical protein